VNAQEPLGREIFLSGQWDTSVTNLVLAILRPGDMVVDIGAHVGYVSLLASKQVGVHGKVYAFEPATATRSMLLDHLKLNGATNIEVRTQAISDRAGTVTFNAVTEGNLGLSSIRAVHESKSSVEVMTARLDDVLVDLKSLRLIKIDIEGAEQLALNGMPHILKKHSPDLIVEVTDRFLREMGSTAQSMQDYMTTFGYKMYAIRNSCDELINLHAGGLNRMPWQFNALFTKSEELPKGFKLRADW